MPTCQEFFNDRAERRELESRRFYHTLLKRCYRFFVPFGQRVVELGSDIGDLLAAVMPGEGVGVDFSPRLIDIARERHKDLKFERKDVAEYEPKEKFDYIIASDLVNDLPDVQAMLEKARSYAHSESRIVLNFFNNLWKPILGLAESLNLKAPTQKQNWLSRQDMQNLLEIAGWEIVKSDTKILCPIPIPLIEPFLNRWIAPLPIIRHLCLTVFIVARPKPDLQTERELSCTVVIPARNEAGNIEDAVKRTPELGKGTEIIFIEGHSTDNTWEEVQRVAKAYPDRNIKTMQQTTKGKGGAVREAFAVATGDVLFILDADLTMPPEELPKFYELVRNGCADFANGVRLVYPMENEAMRFFNMIGNHFFSRAFTWLLGQPIKDTLCGTKVLTRKNYQMIADNRSYFGNFDPFGDFDLLFGATKLNLKIVDLPIRYRARTYGDTNIDRWRHGVILLRMTVYAARRLRFVR
ncbi:MAG: glycosyl transferase [Verrucomicrobiales bacterium]|nr:glycosyl transferase [Verrucomicrobiales bacterium]|tara:strand:+ start:150 stop:1550 length:1401 start_codon:yes stop_codon:yes gene_type:complete